MLIRNGFFSLVKKNKNEFRSNMSLKTLNALLIQKVDMIANHRNCFDSTFEEEVVVAAKKSLEKNRPLCI